MWIATEPQEDLLLSHNEQVTHDQMQFPDRNALYLIGCGVHKQAWKTKAIDLYTSKRFQLARALADALNLDAYILSGKYGVIEPTKQIQPYDFDIRTASSFQQKKWADKAVDALIDIANGRSIVTIANTDYVNLLIRANLQKGERLEITNPFLGVGEHEYERYLDYALSNILRRSHLKAFYSYVNDARAKGLIFPLRDLSKQKLPEAGVYVFFDSTEPNFSDGCGRIVRIGTHAVSANSKSTLRIRLRNHLGLRDGRGNHRGSIFRSHVGAAMIRRERSREKFPFWGLGSVNNVDVIAGEIELEKRVSSYLSQLDVLAIPVCDPPSKLSLRAHIESQLIALCSQGMRSIDSKTAHWLGNESPRSEIQLSGLWNLRGVGKLYDVSGMGAIPQILGLLAEV